MRKILGFIAVVAITIVACNEPPVYKEQVQKETVSYGNGVYYIGLDKREGFGQALAIFREQHQNERIVSVVEDGTAAYGSTRGYFIITEPK